jgi:glycosyltransferase involved in cell wall biosynthesis
MRVIFTVSNDLNYDQRMHRICGSLTKNGFDVVLVGRALPHSIPLIVKPFKQERLRCLFNKGPLFYAEFNLRLCWYLLWKSHYDAVCSIDLDTVCAGLVATFFRGKKRVFDAHEYFSEVPELAGRPAVKWFWEKVAQFILPRYPVAYTVGPSLAKIFEAKYGVKYEVVRNVPMLLSDEPLPTENNPKLILYQGALNQGRGLEVALEAMRQLDGVKLVVAGEGDLSHNLRMLAQKLELGEKVEFLGFVSPDELKKLTQQAWIGLNLLENKGLSYYYSLANKFFDSVQAGVPVLNMDFPEYRALNAEHETSILIPDLKVDLLVEAIGKLLNDKDLYNNLRENCMRARLEWNWQTEERNLLNIWLSLSKA